MQNKTEDLLDRFRKEALEAAPPPVPPIPEAEGKKNKKSKKKASTPNDAELGEAGVTDEDKILKMPEFMDAKHKIEEQLGIIRTLQKDIYREHKRALDAVGVEESLKFSNSINTLTQSADAASNTIRRLLKQIEKETLEVAPLASPGSSSLRGRITQHSHLTNAYLKRMREYKAMQEDCQKLYKEQIKRQYLIVKPEATSKEIEAVLQDTGGAQAQVFAMAVRGQAQAELQKMETRCQDMKKLEQSIVELSQLFINLQQQLISQRDILNKVGVQVQRAEEYTGKALKETEQAAKEAKALHRTRMIIVGVVLLILLIIIGSISIKIYLALAPKRVRLV